MSEEERRDSDERWEAARIRVRLSRIKQGLPAELTEEGAWEMVRRAEDAGILDVIIKMLTSRPDDAASD